MSEIRAEHVPPKGKGSGATFELAAKLYAARDTIRNIHGDRASYEAALAPYRAVIEGERKETGKPVLEVALDCCKVASAKGQGHAVLMFCTAAIEMIEGGEDDAPRPAKQGGQPPARLSCESGVSIQLGREHGSPYIQFMPCGVKSFNLGDIENSYCAHCGRYIVDLGQ